MLLLLLLLLPHTRVELCERVTGKAMQALCV
jgi:hypothetical protein